MTNYSDTHRHRLLNKDSRDPDCHDLTSWGLSQDRHGTFLQEDHDNNRDIHMKSGLGTESEIA